MKRDNIDFCAIPDHLLDAHNRCLNWMRWVRVTPQSGWKTHPMWKESKSLVRQWHEPEYRESCDLLDAQEIELMVRKMRQDMRTAVRWYYISGRDPRGMSRRLGMTPERMFKLILDGLSKISLKGIDKVG